MSLGEILDGARRAVAEAFEPRHYPARPQYGIGYVPVSGLDDDASVGDVWERADEAKQDADNAWMLAAGAIVLAAVVDVVLITRAHRRKRKGSARGRRSV